MNGKYTYIAFAVVMANAFSKHSNAEYPKEPLCLSQREAEMSEEEKEVQRKLFLSQLEVMMANFELTHPKPQE